METFDKFLDCFNVSTFKAGKHSRNAFKSFYYSSNDFRYKVVCVCVCVCVCNKIIRCIKVDIPYFTSGSKQTLWGICWSGRTVCSNDKSFQECTGIK